MNKYHITCTDDVQDFKDWVCARLDEGYKLYGDPFSLPNGAFVQALVPASPMIAETSGVDMLGDDDGEPLYLDNLGCVAHIKIDEKPYRVSYGDGVLELMNLEADKAIKFNVPHEITEGCFPLDEKSKSFAAAVDGIKTGSSEWSDNAGDALLKINKTIPTDSDMGAADLPSEMEVRGNALLELWRRNESAKPTDEEMARLSDADLVQTKQTGQALGKAIGEYGAGRYAATVIAGNAFLAKYPEANRSDYSLFHHGLIAASIGKKEDTFGEVFSFDGYKENGDYIFASHSAATKHGSTALRLLIFVTVVAASFVIAAVNGWLP